MNKRLGDSATDGSIALLGEAACMRGRKPVYSVDLCAIDARISFKIEPGLIPGEGRWLSMIGFALSDIFHGRHGVIRMALGGLQYTAKCRRHFKSLQQSPCRVLPSASARECLQLSGCCGVEAWAEPVLSASQRVLPVAVASEGVLPERLRCLGLILCPLRGEGFSLGVIDNPVLLVISGKFQVGRPPSKVIHCESD